MAAFPSLLLGPFSLQPPEAHVRAALKLLSATSPGAQGDSIGSADGSGGEEPQGCFAVGSGP